MEAIYMNVEGGKPVAPENSTSLTGARRSEQRQLRAVVLSLSLLSVFLLAGILVLGLHYKDSAQSSVAENFTTNADLTERLQASEKQLSSLTEERELLKDKLAEMAEDLSRLQTRARDIAENLTTNADLAEHLQACEKQLNQSETEELKRLQCLSRQRCPTGWTMFGTSNYSCYLLSNGTAVWGEASKYCRARGGHLLVVDSLEEQKFISKCIIKQETWIGLTDRNKNKTWKWINGAPLTVRYWQKGQPDKGGGKAKWGKEDCAVLQPHMNVEENWNDLRCDASRQWICEKTL